MRDELSIVLEPNHFRKTLKIALIVGVVLTAINQLDAVIRGDATVLTFVKTVLNFCVPLTASSAQTMRRRRRSSA
jgi:hypothetical protein